jgi:16S rRNA processing protein RimM
MPETRILLGVIGRAHGVHGLVRVTSYADPPEAIAAYGPLFDDDGNQFSLGWRGEELAEIAEITGGASVRIADRTAAERLINRRLYVARDKLPPPSDDEFYLADLVGLAAVDVGGAQIGTVVSVHDYGAGASLEIAGQNADPLLVPFTRLAVPRVDVIGGRVTVAPPEAVNALPDDPFPSSIRSVARSSRKRRGSEVR